MSDYDLSKIFGGAVFGSLIGAGAIFVQESISNFRQAQTRLDPPAPNLEVRDSKMSSCFKKLITWYYKFCPENLQEIYKQYIKDAIKSAEMVAIIETQLLKKEVEPQLKLRCLANVYANLTMQYLRNIRQVFKTEALIQFSEEVDRISEYMSMHLNNIRVLTK